jgi:hypothetical protein
MSDFLGAHPDIFMARKEMHLFGSDLHFGKHFYRRNREAYLQEFDDWKDQSLGGESSVWYLISRFAATEIHDFNPDARIIIMLREPVEMMHSMHSQFLLDNNEHVSSFAKALAAENERRRGKGLNRRCYFAQGLVYADIVRYVAQVQRYFEVFGRDRVHVILYDDFATDVAEAYRSTLNFLGVDAAGIQPDFKVINGNKGIRCNALQAIVRDPLILSAALAVRPLVPRRVFNLLQKIDARFRRSNSRAEKRRPLDSCLRARLEREFAPEVDRLSELLGRDLSHWSKDNSPVIKQAQMPAPVSP